MPVVSGYITQSNLTTPLPNLEIQQTPYWVLGGDPSDRADTSTQNGFVPGLSVHKRVWADSPYVQGQQLVLATPDNSTLILRMLVSGVSQLDMQNNLLALITAITEQLVFQVSLTFDSASYLYTVYTGDHEEASGGQLAQFGTNIGVPVYLTLPRDPQVTVTSGSWV